MENKKMMEKMPMKMVNDKKMSKIMKMDMGMKLQKSNKKSKK